MGESLWTMCRTCPNVCGIYHCHCGGCWSVEEVKLIVGQQHKSTLNDCVDHLAINQNSIQLFERSSNHLAEALPQTHPQLHSSSDAIMR